MFAQLRAGQHEQAIVGGLRKVRYFDLSGIAPASGSTRGNDRDSLRMAAANQKCFVVDVIDRVQDIIVMTSQKFGGVGGSEQREHMVDDAVGIDRFDPLGHDFDLRLADREIGGRELAVDVEVCTSNINCSESSIRSWIPSSSSSLNSSGSFGASSNLTYDTSGRNLQVSGSMQYGGTGSETCSSAADFGKNRRNPTSDA